MDKKNGNFDQKSVSQPFEPFPKLEKPVGREGLQRKSRRICTGKSEELERKARFAAPGRKRAKIPNRGKSTMDFEKGPSFSHLWIKFSARSGGAAGPL
jgi:hypothetical protein